MDARSASLRRRIAQPEIALAVEYSSVELSSDELDGLARVAQRKAAPPCQIPLGGGPAAPKVPPRELRKRPLACERPRFRGSIRDQREGGLLAFPSAAAEHAAELGVDEQVRKSSLALDALTQENGCQLRPRELLATAERIREKLARALERLRIEPDLAKARRCGCDDARPDQREHPAEVLGRHELPGAAKAVSANQVACVESSLHRSLPGAHRPRADSPQRPEVILRLHGAEPAHHLAGRLRSLSREKLMLEPARNDVHGKAHFIRDAAPSMSRSMSAQVIHGHAEAPVVDDARHREGQSSVQPTL